MLIKYLMNKLMKAWDLYLTQALLVTRIYEYAVTGFSLFYLVYSIHPRIPSDNESIVAQSSAERTNKLQNMSDAQMKANELLLARAIRMNWIHDSLVMRTSFQEGDWVLIRNENRKKFKSKWFGPYWVLKSHPLGTYSLEEPNGHML